MTLSNRQKWLIGIAVVVIGIIGFNRYGHVEEAKSPKIAIVRVEGVISSGENGGDVFSGSAAGANTIMSQLRKARKDEGVKGVLLRIDSPGGSAAASEEIATEIEKIKEVGKPVVVSMGDMAASGGYWIAAYGDKIYANDATITGSIGVYMGYTNLQSLYEKIGIREEKIKSGAHKDMMSSTREMTEEERALIQNMVNDMYGQFLEVVAKGRHKSVEDIRPLADGRILTGRQAKAAGLVDEIGNYYDALGYLAEQLGMDPNDVPIVEYDDMDGFTKLMNKLRLETVRSFGLSLQGNPEAPRAILK